MMQVAIGARVMLRRNVCTIDGLVNNAMGTIVGFEWAEGQRILGLQPCGIRILFDDQKVGRQTRGTTDLVATTIRASTSRFNGKDPVVLAWAVTMHKVQGISLDKAVIDCGSDIFDHGQAYTALSRVRMLEGVLLIG